MLSIYYLLGCRKSYGMYKLSLLLSDLICSSVRKNKIIVIFSCHTYPHISALAQDQRTHWI